MMPNEHNKVQNVYVNMAFLCGNFVLNTQIRMTATVILVHRV